MICVLEKKISGEVSSLTKEWVSSSFVCLLTRAMHCNRLGTVKNNDVWALSPDVLVSLV